MENQEVMLSSAGLKNIVLNSNAADNNFHLFFGDKELLINNIFAEFISPAISRLHKSDPTINSIDIKKLFVNPIKHNEQNYADILNNETISLIDKLSKGNSVKVPENQLLSMQIISILLGNEELFQKISNLNSIENDQNSIEFYLQQIELFYYCSRSSNNLFDYSKAINFVSSHLYSINDQRLKKLPKTVLYSLISNANLKIRSEDWLFDFINQIFKGNKRESEEEISISEFYEQVNFLALSEAKFEEFLENFEISEMTNSIWQKLSKCFYIYYYMAFGQTDKSRYEKSSSEKGESDNFFNEKSEATEMIDKFINSKLEENNRIQTNNNQQQGIIKFEYDGTHNFNGVINRLNDESGNNITEKVNVTSSSRFIGKPIFVTELNDKLKYFMSDDRPDSWIKYEFLGFKLHPTRYSIRTWNNAKKGGHLKSWVVEASNTNRDDDWKVLDTRNDVEGLDNNNAEVNFEIQTKLNSNEFFKFIRLKQTDVNVSGKNFLILSAFELFGNVIYDD